MSSWVCAVPDCKNNSSNSHITFKHDFPRGGLMKQKWLDACGIKDINKSGKQRVCRDHFHETDYVIFSSSPNGGSRLKPNVVPSKNLGMKRTLRSRTATPVQETETKMEDGLLDDDVTLEELKAAARNTSMKVMLDKREAVNGFARKHSNNSSNGFNNGHVTPSPCKKLKMTDAKEPEKLPTTSQAMILLMNNDPYKYLGLTPPIIDLVEVIASNLSISEINIILTFRKLKLDEDFGVLDDYFHLKEGEAKELFLYTVETISKYMHTLVQLPSKYVCFEHIPVSNRRTLCQTRFFLSYFSVVIEKTQDLYTNEMTFTGTKYVINYFYLLTPDGYIAYVSPGYGARLSPLKTIPAIKGIRELTENGFNKIELVDEFSENDPNPEENLNFEQKMALETVKRMRQFAMLDNKKAVGKDFIKCLDEMVVIVAAILNLQSVNYDEDDDDEGGAEGLALDVDKKSD